MRTLRKWLRHLFLRNKCAVHPRAKELGQDRITFEAWIDSYCQRLRQKCEKNEHS